MDKPYPVFVVGTGRVGSGPSGTRRMMQVLDRFAAIRTALN